MVEVQSPVVAVGDVSDMNSATASVALPGLHQTPPPYLSPSSASAYEQCPRRWQYKYIERLPEPSGRAALVGTFAHQVLELLCGLPSAHRTTDQAKAIASEIWPDFATDDDYLSLELDEEEARSFRWQGWLAITGLWDLEDPATVDVVSTEKKVAVKLGDVPFKGIIDRVDRIDDKLVVSDYKSGTAPSSRWQGDKLLQVMLYAAALGADGGEMPERARLLYLGQKIIEVGVTDRRLEEATEQLSGTWTNISSSCTNDQFEPSPGVLCGWCPFVERCEAGTEEIKRRSEEGTLPAHAPAVNLTLA